MVTGVVASYPRLYAQYGLAQIPVCGPVEGACGCGGRHTGKQVGKAPLVRGGFKAATTDVLQLDKWATQFPGCNWGANLHLSNLAVVDTDSVEADKEVGLLGVPKTFTVVTGSGGRHRYYRLPATVPALVTVHNGKSSKVDILADGYAILPPSMHSSGNRYQWEISPENLDTELPELPDWACTLLFSAWVKSSGGKLSLKLSRLLQGLDSISSVENGVDRSETLFALACELFRAKVTLERVQDILCDRDKVLGAFWPLGPKFYGRRDASLRYAEIATKAQDSVGAEPKLVLGGTKRGQVVSSSKEAPADLAQALRSLEKTDAGNAEAMALLHGSRIAYNPAQQRWYRWEKHSWSPATDGDVHLAALESARVRLGVAVRNSDDKGVTWALRSQDAYRIESAVKLGKVTLARKGIWDEQDYLLATASGVVDLLTGDIRPGEPADLISMASPVEYKQTETCPRFDYFLSQVFDNDEGLVRFLWRAIGYSLSGATQEECLFLLHGTGTNGKGTLDWVLREILGSYYLSAPFSSFEEQKNESSTNDLAMLAGKRMVSASENSEGRRLNEGRIKRATGRDPITARFLHREFFSYVPRFKLWLQTNHLPVIRGTDEGIWRRMRLIPFNVSFRGREDHGLRDALLSELPGILAKAIRSARDWKTSGGIRLEQAPESLRLATQGYRYEMDTLQGFLDDCCEQDEGLEVDSGKLYRSYRGWATERGEYILGHTGFARKLVDKGLDRKRSRGQRIFTGLALNDTGADFAQKSL